MLEDWVRIVTNSVVCLFPAQDCKLKNMWSRIFTKDVFSKKGGKVTKGLQILLSLFTAEENRSVSQRCLLLPVPSEALLKAK